jgi:hypothetical protein
MPAQGLYEYLLLHKPWQPPQAPLRPFGTTSVAQLQRVHRQHQEHQQLVRGITALRAAAAAESRGQQGMLADLAAARQLYQLDQVRTTLSYHQHLPCSGTFLAVACIASIMALLFFCCGLPACPMANRDAQARLAHHDESALM